MPPVGFDYYAALARTLTPVDLAQLAVRKLKFMLGKGEA